MRSYLVLIIIFCWAVSDAQDFKDIYIDESDNGKILLEYFFEIEEKYEVDVICDEKQMRALTIVAVQEKQRLTEYLNNTLINFKTTKVKDNVLFIVGRELGEKFGLRKENYIIFKSPQASKISLEGVVRDGRTNDPLIGSQIYFPKIQKGSQTDANGKFSVPDVTPDILAVDINYLGYESNTFILGFSRYGVENQISATLFPASKQLESVTITAERINENIASQLTGIEKFNIQAIKAMPAFLGEVDPIRSLTTLPGVNTVGELASGFNVRGGESGQNLVLQDGAVIYNPSHLFGFFSAFNPDMVSEVTLYKGGGPANFGGRISSVLDVSLKNGDAAKPAVSGGLGLVSSRLTLEGPIVRNKSSYVVGGRISYSNWLVKSIDNIQLKNSDAKFYDITGKIFQTINENNFLTLSFYHSYDAFKLASDSVFSWGTNNYSLKWDHTFRENLFSTLNVSNSNYFSETHSNNALEGFTYRNAINNLTLKYELTYALSDESKILTGVESTGTLVEPGKRDPNENIVSLNPENMKDQRSIESAVFLQGDFKLSSKWSVVAGLRCSYFLRLGKDDIYEYDYSEIKNRYPTIRDTITYSSGEVIKKYSGLEPRVSVRYMITEDASLKASYYRGNQYMHLISNTTSVTPQDYWIASGPYIKPQIGSQFSLGYFNNFKNNLYEFSVEGFYKDIANAIDYIEGADITLNPALEAGLSQGKGLAYGFEVLFKKTSGKINGWLAYTYSRSLRKFRGAGDNIAINNGKYYPSAFDQPNHVSLVLNYQLGGRTSLSANYNYSTGRPITIPVSKFSYDAYLSVLNYSERNEYRIPDYHRLDVSMTIKDNPKKNRRLRSEWVISVFNVYGRKNAYSIYFDHYGNARKVSVLGSVFPSITYNFRF